MNVSNALVRAGVCFSKVIGELSVMAETCVYGFLDTAKMRSLKLEIGLCACLNQFCGLDLF